MIFAIEKAAKRLLPSIIRKNILFYLSPFYARKRIKRWNGLPQVLLIENTNHCNSKCIMCPHVKMERKKGIMSFGLFKNIIDEGNTLGIKRAYLNAGIGEPLIDPLLFEKICYAKKAGIREVNLFTNASLLDKKKQEELLTSGIDSVVISIDGFTKEDYEKFRKGLSFDKVKENVLSFLQLKQLKRLKKPYIIILGLYSMHLKRSALNSTFYKEVKKLADWISISGEHTLHDWAGSVKVDRKHFNNYNQPCRRLWASFFILWDGKVPLCCFDYEGSCELGNVTKQSIREIYNNPKFKQLRNYHLKGEFDKIKLCKNCFERPSWVNERSERILGIFEPYTDDNGS